MAECKYRGTHSIRMERRFSLGEPQEIRFFIGSDEPIAPPVLITRAGDSEDDAVANAIFELVCKVADAVQESTVHEMVKGRQLAEAWRAGR